MAKIDLIHGDCLEEIPKLIDKGIVVDSIVTDPPYHLISTVKRFSKEDSAPPVDGSHYKRLVKGFMGQTWDGGDIAFRPETWSVFMDILRPGGFLLSFGGTRTFHRLACAIEDSGFVLQDVICWLYGRGFPKRHDMLKPAWEPIIVAYKPGGDRTLQVEECRIGEYGGMGNVKLQYNEKKSEAGWGFKKCTVDDTIRGRYPANVCHDGSDEVEEAFAKFGSKGGGPRKQGNGIVFANREFGWSNISYNDSGNASRFFYSAKASTDERAGSKHPTVKPVELMQWLVPLVTPKGGTVLDPFAGSGTTGLAAIAKGRNAILIDKEDQYQEDIRKRVRKTTGFFQDHYLKESS